jgi:hypothetical protein
MAKELIVVEARYISRAAMYKIKIFDREIKQVGSETIIQPSTWAEFNNGVFTTSDEKIIKRMDELALVRTSDFWRVDSHNMRVIGDAVSEAKDLKAFMDKRRAEVTKAPKMKVGAVDIGPLGGKETKDEQRNEDDSGGT